MRITFTCVECNKEMVFELEVDPYGWLTCPECKKKICVDFGE